MQVKINTNGFIEEFLLDGSVGVLPDSVEVALDDTIDLEDFLYNFHAYKVVDGKLEIDTDKHASIVDENAKELLRQMRARECFPVINRGVFWYDTLSEDQRAELQKWYKDWLDVTDTNEIPTKPSWID